MIVIQARRNLTSAGLVSSFSFCPSFPFPPPAWLKCLPLPSFKIIVSFILCNHMLIWNAVNEVYRPINHILPKRDNLSRDRNIMALLTVLNEATVTKHLPLASKHEHVNVFCPGREGASWSPRLPSSSYSSLIYASETELKLPRRYPRRWWSRHTEAAAIQSGKHLKVFVMKRV